MEQDFKTTGEVKAIPLSKIFVDDDFNCRGFIDPTSIHELAKSIQESGLQYPVLVTNHEGDHPFKLVAGFRRYKAHEFLNKLTIDCIVRPNLDDTAARILNLIENLQRKDLNIKQEAHAIERLRFLGPSEISKRLQVSYGWVQNRLALLELPDPIQDDAAAGLININQVKTISQLGSVQMMYDFVKKLKDAKLKDLKREPKVSSIKVNNEKRLRSKDEIFELQETIRECLGNSLTTKVLGWAAGELTDLEIHSALQKAALAAGKFYDVPSGME